MDSTAADESTVKEAVARVRSALDSEMLPVPAGGFWTYLEQEVRAALERNDEREGPVREAVEEWLGGKLLRDPAFSVDQSLRTSEDVAVQLELAYHQERRSVTEVAAPFRGQTREASVEDVWQRPIADRFKPASYKWPRQGTGTVDACPRCNRTGKILCHKCSGNGLLEEKCAKCGGRGEIERHDKVVGGETGGGRGLGGAVILRKEQCRTCNGTGKLEKRCPECKGHGEVTCPVCEGAHDVWRHEIIEAEVTVYRTRVLVPPNAQVNARWISSALGRAIKLENTFGETVNQGRQLAKELTSGRPRYEEITMRVVPITTAAFAWKGRERKVYIVDGKVHSHDTGSFLGKRRVAVAAVIGAALLVIGWLGYSAVSRSGPAGDRSTSAHTAVTATAYQTVIVTAQAANVRAGGSTADPVLGDVVEGDSLRVAGTAIHGWLPVRFRGRLGYIEERLVREALK